MATKLTEDQSKALIKKKVREEVSIELMKIRAFFLPFVDESEQKEIERIYREPSREIAKSYQVEV